MHFTCRETNELSLWHLTSESHLRQPCLPTKWWHPQIKFKALFFSLVLFIYFKPLNFPSLYVFLGTPVRFLFSDHKFQFCGLDLPGTSLSIIQRVSFSIYTVWYLSVFPMPWDPKASFSVFPLAFSTIVCSGIPLAQKSYPLRNVLQSPQIFVSWILVLTSCYPSWSRSNTSFQMAM